MSESLQIFTLGKLSLTRNGAPIAGLTGRKAEAFLVYLACTGRAPSREALAGLLWGERRQKQAMTNLRVLLTELRRTLGDHLIITRQSVAFNQASPYWLDVAELEQGLMAFQARPDALTRADLTRLEQALALYQGEFLAGFSLRDSPAFEEWLTLERERWHLRVIDGFHTLVTAYLALDAYSPGLEAARRLLQLDPLREEGQRQVMELLALSGQRSAALAQYETCRRLLADELGIEPAAETVALYERIRAGELSRGAGEQERGREVFTPAPLPLRSPAPLPPTPWQHPPLPAGYISRPELEQAILSQLQAQQVMVLTGLGGAGKSTLAAWLARQVAGSLVEGVIWVDDCQREPGGFDVFEAQRRIARSCQVELQGQSLAERAGELRSLLRDKAYLLVMDDVWDSPDLVHLRLHHDHSPLLVTSRSTTVAHRFDAHPPLQIGGLTQAEGRDLLKHGLEVTVTTAELNELVSRVGHLPLALTLLRALLEQGYTLAELLAHFRQETADLSLLELGAPSDRGESLNACFDLSYHRLPSVEAQQGFAQLGCFSGTFDLETAVAVWGLERLRARYLLDQLVRLALLSQAGQRYRLHPLLRDYARQKLATWPDLAGVTRRRHAATYIRQALYHPQVLPGVTQAAPPLDETWADIVAGVQWAAANAPELATYALLLAHTERPALLEAVGPALIEAIQRYLESQAHVGLPIALNQRAMSATLYELLGDLHLLQQNLAAALTCFEQAEALWLSLEDGLASGRARLRQAGLYLLQQAFSPAAEAARQAQSYLAASLPLAAPDLPAARRLFYWFDMVYVALVRRPELPQADVARLADLAGQTGDDRLKATGLHIYRLWCTVEAIDRLPEIRTQGRELAQQAIRLWQAGGEMDKADSEALWSEYQLTGRCDPAAAVRFARRLSDSTPDLSLAQMSLIDNEGIHWWLQTTEAERVAWLSRMLPRYLGASNCPDPPLEPDSQAWQWIRDIIGLRGSLRPASRRFVLERHLPPPQHFLNIPEWRVFSGQRVFSLVDEVSEQLVNDCLAALEAELSFVIGH